MGVWCSCFHRMRSAAPRLSKTTQTANPTPCMLACSDMTKKPRKATAPPDRTAARDVELRAMLMTRRREMQLDVQERVRDERTRRTHEVLDDVEHSEGHHQTDIDLALLQMRSETLVRIDHALARLDAGQYGSCVECEAEIAERRLRALPFAIRCQRCEQTREHAQARTERLNRAGQRSAMNC
jgi:DnaK suppressor protein